MRAFLKIECKRVIKSWGFRTSVLIGALISLTQYIMVVFPMRQYLDTYEKAELSMIMPHTVFTKWLGGEAISVQHFLLLMILPLICVVPWSISTYTDRKEGIVKNYFIRAQKCHYYSAKYIVNFIVGGVVSIFPLISNLMLTSATLPSLKPEVSTGTFAIRTDSLFADLFYSRPYIYIFTYLLIIFVFCGIVSCFATSIGILLDNSFTIILLPFIMHLFLYTMCSSVNMQKYAPFYFLDPFQNASSVSFEIILIEALILILISIFSYLRGIKDEIL